MRAIDQTVTLPYSFPWTYGQQPERISFWDYLGTYGNYSNGYCVTNEFYPRDLVPCVKRQWSPRGTIYPWATPELGTHWLQVAQTVSQLLSMNSGLHFQLHLNCGGYPGQYSIKNAPYELVPWKLLLLLNY